MRYVDCEYHLMGVDGSFWGRLHSVAIDCDGPLVLGGRELATLRGLEFDPVAYGQYLFSLLFPQASALLQGYQQTLAFLRGKGKEEGLRFRLNVAPGVPPTVQDLVWERLHDGQQPLAASPGVAFSRYLAVGKPLGTALQGRPRLLVAISAPPDLPRYGLTPIDLPQVRSALERHFQAHLGGRIAYEFFDRPVDRPLTAGALLELLQTGTFHALHLVAHGLPPGLQAAGLVLQSANRLAAMVSEQEVAKIFRGSPKLLLVTLIACHSSAPSGFDPFQGLAGRLVDLGVPAVVAMRREISFEAAELFSQHLYRSLAVSGAVDVAVSAARQQLALAPGLQEWDVPVLFLRLRDSRLWVPFRTWVLAVLVIPLLGAALYLSVVLVPWRDRWPRPEPPPPVATETVSPAGETARPEPPVEATSPAVPPPDPAPTSLTEQLAAARRYCQAGGKNLEQGVRAYRQILNGLSPKVRASLDQKKLARAEKAASPREAADLYELVLSGLEPSKPDTHSEP